mmetsp:Transcript_28299/g.45648  ORF Transcript_28299/g.45648 Transcript_28299/m.45648 type:complete len:98 (-) Transcript_28299:2371-2664(-)
MASMFLDGWAAALKGDKKRLEELVKAGNHDINLPHPKSGQTVLHLACLQGNEDIAGMLLMRGATTDKLDSIVGETGTLAYSLLCKSGINILKPESAA